MLRDGGQHCVSLIATELYRREGNALKMWHAVGTAGQNKALNSTVALLEAECIYPGVCNCLLA